MKYKIFGFIFLFIAFFGFNVPSILAEYGYNFSEDFEGADPLDNWSKSSGASWSEFTISTDQAYDGTKSVELSSGTQGYYFANIKEDLTVSNLTDGFSWYGDIVFYVYDDDGGSNGNIIFNSGLSLSRSGFTTYSVCPQFDIEVDSGVSTTHSVLDFAGEEILIPRDTWNKITYNFYYSYNSDTSGTDCYVKMNVNDGAWTSYDSESISNTQYPFDGSNPTFDLRFDIAKSSGSQVNNTYIDLFGTSEIPALYLPNSVNYINIDTPVYNQVFSNTALSAPIQGSYSYVSGFDIPSSYDTLYFEVVNFNDLETLDLSSQDIDLSVDSYGSFDFGISLQPDTNYTVRACFKDSLDSSIVPYCSYPVNFSTGSGGGITSVLDERLPCSVSQIDNCIKNALTWAFIPSQASLQRLSNITLTDRIPFSYINDLDDLYNALFNQTSDELDITLDTSIGSLTILSAGLLEAVPFQGEILAILSAMLWFFTAMTIYRRVVAVHG